jgi:hypothetical protein
MYENEADSVKMGAKSGDRMTYVTMFNKIIDLRSIHGSWHFCVFEVPTPLVFEPGEEFDLNRLCDDL